MSRETNLLDPGTGRTGHERLANAFAELSAEDGIRHSPFRWQTRLLRRLLQSDLPKAVDVPTGLGKTSVMALWLIALAEGATLPRRLVYVVDRRAVVDQATRFAERLRTNMPDELGSRLQLTEGLPISTLRGSFADNRDWLEDPSQPAIVVGTIDMIGSRLLFEGYGVSGGMRPYHAGLLGADALVLLDEAHLCPPFEALLRQVETHRDGSLGPTSAGDPCTPPFHLMSLSATGRDLVQMRPGAVFRLERDDLTEPVVRQRLMARKRLLVTEIADGRSLTECLTDRAIELGGTTRPTRVIVYCDRRKDAVDVKQSIDRVYLQMRKAGELAAGHESELLVGERRVYERAALEDWLDRHGFLGGANATPQVPTFLVATSAGEVGVDLDADHLVCDLVAYERMVQRIGRVNRRGGETRTAMIDVFAARPELKARAGRAEREKYARDLASFGGRLAVLRQLPRSEDERQDASPSAIVELKSKHADIVNAATTPAQLHPELTRPLLDAWAMTSLKRHEGRPEVAPWLRGWEEDEGPQTSVVWRKHLPLEVRADDATVSANMVLEFFRVASVNPTERLEAQTSMVIDWLLKRAAQMGKRRPNDIGAVSGGQIVAIVVDGKGEYVESASATELLQLAAPAKTLNRSDQRQRDRRKRDWKERHLPGATLFLDARVGGLHDGMLHEKSEQAVATADADEGWREIEEDPRAERSRPLIRFRVEELAVATGGEGLSGPDEFDDWSHARTFETQFDANGAVQRGLAVFKWPDDAADEDSRSILSAPAALA